jgi:hypothetical protein
MTTVQIRIPIGSEWPTPKELDCRNAVEAALNASSVGQCTGAGGGCGEMDLSYRVNDDSRLAAARAAIDQAMAYHMPGVQYQVAIRSDTATGVQVRVGDVFAIPLTERAHALGLCTFVFQRLKGFIACRIFDVLVPQPRMVQPLPARAAFDPIFLATHSIADATWPIIGSAHIEPGPIMYRSAGGIYNGDDYLRPDDGSDELPKLLLAGPVAVQNQLRKYFRARLPAAVDEKERIN